jgi:hypothetical protein
MFAEKPRKVWPIRSSSQGQNHVNPFTFRVGKGVYELLFSTMTLQMFSPMGGERSSRARQREIGKICCACEQMIDTAWPGGERYCDRCAAERAPRHKIYMHFMLTGGWFCQFLEQDLKTPLPRKLIFAGPEKIREIYDRFGIDKKLEDRSALEYGIDIGRGSVWLSLTPEQYGK